MTQKLPPLTPMICAYPECPNMFWITLQQKREFKTYNVLKYGDSIDPYCSTECQQKHLKELSEAEFLDKGTIKNREYALIIHGVDVTKRPKEKEVHVITGNVTEQRARCLYDKLQSIQAGKKKKCLSSMEVQDFLFNELPADIKATKRSLRLAAYNTMNKTKELYPNLISIEYINNRYREILLIN